ncbi:hypothetical protein H1D32_22300 [Anaerobacillus sp. CMMVII]|uniref:hypothetical protein n=1 Tax=Anaerobacillus sp. CMMVII TaxID=2755588 RepID=UPI0021B7EF5E|nr:hypothetical protein [Anaerobacillus sp. CMMVII]MCT8140187.1 hypothetical protein [Anaerobacillus sp. CMMVII]
MNKLLPLPQKFDENEWFFIISLMIAIIAYWRLPKKFKPSITILLLIFGATVARVADKLLAAPKTNFYNVVDTGKYELFDVISYPLYSFSSYFFIYVYSHFQFRGIGLVLFIVFTSLAGTLYEYLGSLFHFFKYDEWHVFYSFSVYLFVQPLTILFFHVVTYFHSKKE